MQASQAALACVDYCGGNRWKTVECGDFLAVVLALVEGYWCSPGSPLLADEAMVTEAQYAQALKNLMQKYEQDKEALCRGKFHEMYAGASKLLAMFMSSLKVLRWGMGPAGLTTSEDMDTSGFKVIDSGFEALCKTHEAQVQRALARTGSGLLVSDIRAMFEFAYARLENSRPAIMAHYGKMIGLSGSRAWSFLVDAAFRRHQEGFSEDAEKIIEKCLAAARRDHPHDHLRIGLLAGHLAMYKMCQMKFAEAQLIVSLRDESEREIAASDVKIWGNPYLKTKASVLQQYFDGNREAMDEIVGVLHGIPTSVTPPSPSPSAGSGTTAGKSKKKGQECARCKKWCEKPKFCSGCRGADGSRIAYCDQECQKADWKRHKPECQARAKERDSTNG